jgi:hypothetical protein
MLYWGLVTLALTTKSFICNQIEIQYQIIHEKLKEIESANELKDLVANYWEENHKHCFYSDD